jgi:hypothetical protein
MIECQDEELVRLVEQLEQEPIDRGACILDALAEHAVADVERDAEAHRHPLVGELGDRLADAVLEDGERFASQAGDEVSVLVGDGRRDADDFDAGLERPVGSERRLLRRQQRGRGEERHRGRQAQQRVRPASHRAVLCYGGVTGLSHTFLVDSREVRDDK